MITVYFECGDLAYESPVPEARRVDAKDGFLYSYNIIKALAEDTQYDYIIYTNSLAAFAFGDQKTYVRDKRGWVDIHQSEYVNEITNVLAKIGKSYLLPYYQELGGTIND